VGLGIAYNFTSYPKNIWEEVNTTQNTTKTMDDFLDYEKGWISGLGHLGVTIKDFDFILGSKIYGAFERYEFINISFHTYSLRAAYRF
jgi:hypothetical protein